MTWIVPILKLFTPAPSGAIRKQRRFLWGGQVQMTLGRRDTNMGAKSASWFTIDPIFYAKYGIEWVNFSKNS